MCALFWKIEDTRKLWCEHQRERRLTARTITNFGSILNDSIRFDRVRAYVPLSGGSIKSDPVSFRFRQGASIRATKVQSSLTLSCSARGHVRA